MHLDLEIGPAIAIDVALDSHEPIVIDEMQLASVAVKVPRADEVEVLIAVRVSVGVDIVDIDLITIKPNAIEIR